MLYFDLLEVNKVPFRINNDVELSKQASANKTDFLLGNLAFEKANF